MKLRFKVNIRGEYFTLLTVHEDKPGVMAEIANILQDFDINIAEMKLNRQNKGKTASATIKLDQPPDKNVIILIRKIPEIEMARDINPINRG